MNGSVDAMRCKGLAAITDGAAAVAAVASVVAARVVVAFAGVLVFAGCGAGGGAVAAVAVAGVVIAGIAVAGVVGFSSDMISDSSGQVSLYAGRTPRDCCTEMGRSRTNEQLQHNSERNTACHWDCFSVTKDK